MDYLVFGLWERTMVDGRLWWVGVYLFVRMQDRSLGAMELRTPLAPGAEEDAGDEEEIRVGEAGLDVVEVVLLDGAGGD